MTETLHYITEAFDMRKLTLEVTPIWGAHTGANIKFFWEESFARYSLEKEKMSMMLRDNASGLGCSELWMYRPHNSFGGRSIPS